jgi:(p)ppGpp synthase/HD superfamily hydrolase
MKINHGKQKRMGGALYYTHPYAVYKLMLDNNFGIEYQIVALLHDLIEDTNVFYEDILDISNERVAKAVKVLTKEDGYIMDEYIARIKDNELALMVKLADRVHNLSDAVNGNEKFRKKYIIETEKYFIDLAKGSCLEEELDFELNKVKKSLGFKKGII